MKGRIIIALGIALNYAPTLLAQTTGTYIGVGLARADTHIEDMTPETLPYSYVFTSPPGFFTTSQGNPSPNSTWTIFGGYKFNRYLAIEGSYQPLGEYQREGSARGLADTNELRRLGLGTPPPGIAIYDVDRLKLQGYGLSALFSYPVANYIDILGKLGGFYWTGTLDRSATFFQSKVDGTKIGTLMSTESGSGFSPLFGVGARIDIKRNLSVRAEWSHISGIGSGLSTGKSDANVSSLSAQINF